MKELILKLNNQILDDLDMRISKYISNDEYKSYYNEVSSKEHYRLLTYITNSYNGINIIDIGTLKGCSALALSTNKLNNVYSFNVSDQLELNEKPKNIEFIIDNIINGNYDELILKSPVILLDTYHDGTFEKQFLDYISNINYKGTIILDDIHLNKEMGYFWNQINLDKDDITHLGHSTGTGVVYIN